MRLTIVRQDYRPEGTVERVTERALEALLERNVAVSLYTRSWPQTRLQLVEPLVFDPFHVGALWRDWSFARAACRDVRRSQPSLVESHERLLCCDIYRASDGVHAVWLEEQAEARDAGRAHRARCCRRTTDICSRIEKRLYASPLAARRDLQFEDGQGRDPPRFAVPESKLHVIYNPVDGDVFHPGLRAERAAILARHRHRCRGDGLSRSPPTIFARADVGDRDRCVRAARAAGAPHRAGRRQRGARAISRGRARAASAIA